MNAIAEPHPLPDTSTLEAELVMCNAWDSQGVADLIRAKGKQGQSPAFLFLGTCEAVLLKAHFAEAFGAEAVATLQGNYYMGLEIIEIACPSFIHVGGRKVSHRAGNDTPRRSTFPMENMWQFRL